MPKLMTAMNKKCLVLKAAGGSGLGDLIKSLLVAVAYASLTKRYLFVDWSNSVYSEENVFALFFKLEGIQQLAELPSSGDIFPRSWNGRLNKSLHQVYHDDEWSSWDRNKVIETYSFDLSSLNYEHDVLVMWEFDQAEKLFPFLNGIETELSFYQYVFTNFVKFGDEFQSQLDSRVASLKHPMLGVHVRATNEFNINKASSLTVDDYFFEVDQVMALNEVETLFLATDNANVQSEFEQRYDNVISIDKWFSQPGEPLHLDSHCPNEISNIHSALMDIALLSRSDFLVVTPSSSFSQIAVIFSSLVGRNMIVIKPYKKNIKTKFKKLVKIFSK